MGSDGLLATSEAFSGFSVDDLDRAHDFYTAVLGLEAERQPDQPVMQLNVSGGRRVLVYAKDNHVPATYTTLNFPVPDIDAAVDALVERGVQMLRYDDFPQDDKGVMRGYGPDIAWFTDPAGNILSVLAE